MNDGDADYRYTSDKNAPVINTSYEEIKMNFDSSSDDDDDDEEECRVCRGPSEDG
jgi:hypothetical protein